jgi:hypothetical protein
MFAVDELVDGPIAVAVAYALRRHRRGGEEEQERTQ